MKIKYLKNAPLGAVGDIGDVPDDQARILIDIGYAVAVVDEPPPKSKRKKSDNATSELQ